MSMCEAERRFIDCPIYALGDAAHAVHRDKGVVRYVFGDGSSIVNAPKDSEAHNERSSRRESEWSWFPPKEPSA